MTSDRFLVGLYIRLSKEDEGKGLESESITNQRNLIFSYVQEDPSFVIVEEYIDDGYSGTSFDRPAFQRMLQDIESGKINTVITKDLSRFGREYSLTGHYLEKYFPERGVRYIAILDQVDTWIDNSSNEMVPFKAVFNDLYAKDISKKVRGSLTVLKRQGKYTGARAPFGYSKDPDNKHHLIVSPKEASWVKRMFDLVLEGKGVKEIADLFSLEQIPTPSMCSHKLANASRWSPRTVLDILTNPTYRGCLTQGKRQKINYKIKKERRVAPKDWIIVENTHEPIVEKNVFEQVQVLLSKNKKVALCHLSFLLSGFLVCAECHHSIGILQAKNRKQAYTSCTYYRKYSKFHLCTPHTLNYFQLEQQVFERLRTLIQKVDPSGWRRSSSHKPDWQQEKSREEDSLKQNLYTLDTVYLQYLDHQLEESMYLRIADRLRKEQEGIRHRLSQIEDRTSQSTKKSLLSLAQQIDRFFQQEVFDRRFLSLLIDHITISQRKEITIYYRFCKESESIILK